MGVTPFKRVLACLTHTHTLAVPKTHRPRSQPGLGLEDWREILFQDVKLGALDIVRTVVRATSSALESRMTSYMHLFSPHNSNLKVCSQFKHCGLKAGRRTPVTSCALNMLVEHAVIRNPSQSTTVPQGWT